MPQDNSFDLVNDFALFFNSIVLEALPFVVLGVVLAGILEEYVPQQWIKNLFGDATVAGETTPRATGILGFVQGLMRFRLAAIAVGGLLGLIFPMCECGIIAVMRRLVRKGVPLSVCICYMLAGPIINVVVLLSTFVAFDVPDEKEYVLGGPYMVTLLRAGLGFLIACTTALVVNWQYRKHGDSLLHPSLIVKRDDDREDETDKEPRTTAQRLRSISETALHDFIDIMTFLILGACLATIGRMSLENETIKEQTESILRDGPPAISILLMMLVAVVFCLCSEADAFVAANFPRVWPPASKLAFLVLGPMFDLKLLMMYTRIFRKRLIVIIVLSVVVQVFIYCLIVHYQMPYHGYPERYILTGR